MRIAKYIGPDYGKELVELEKSISRSSEIIKNQARIIDYLKNNPMKAIVDNNCINQNFHLKNSDFGYSDLYIEDTIVINRGFIYKEKFYLRDIKFLDINHSGISFLENTGDKYILKLAKKTNFPRAIDLIGEFKKEDNTICQIPIRIFFFGKKIIPQKSELLKLYKNVSVIGKIGDQAGKFNLPYGSTFYKGKLFITDCINNKIQVFNDQGRRLVTFGQSGNKTGQLGGVCDIQVINDKIYITEGKNHRISVFGFNGKFIESFGSYADAKKKPYENVGKFNTPIGLDITEKNLIIADHVNSRLQSINIENGKPNWVSYNKEDDDFDWMEPYYVKVDKKRDLIFVSNRTRNNIGVMNMSGEKLYKFGDDILDYPHELDIDKNGNIYIADSKNYRIIKFKDALGKNYEEIKFSKFWGYPKTVSVDENNSIAIGFGALNNTYVLLLSNKNIQNRETNKFEKFVRAINQINFDYYSQNKMSNFRTPELYDQYCSVCHAEGNFGAPTRGNLVQWEKYGNNINKLLSSTISGKGAMMAKGGCEECSIEDLKNLIEYMLPMDWK